MTGCNRVEELVAEQPSIDGGEVSSWQLAELTFSRVTARVRGGVVMAGLAGRLAPCTVFPSRRDIRTGRARLAMPSNKHRRDPARNVANQLAGKEYRRV